jgi:hypothetical protein
MVGYIYSYGLSLVGHSIVTRVLHLQQGLFSVYNSGAQTVENNKNLMHLCLRGVTHQSGASALTREKLV